MTMLKMGFVSCSLNETIYIYYLRSFFIYISFTFHLFIIIIIRDKTKVFQKLE